jgi:PAS domain S-box-containing protein/diguanylate cyclase (GGDEF)-like protein
MSEIHDPEIFRTVLDSLAMGVYLVDRNGKILFWNEGAEHITGHLGHEVIGHLCTDSILAQCNQQSCSGCGDACPFRDVQREGKARELRLALHHKLGHSVPVLFRITPIRDLHGSIVYVAGSFDEQRRATEDKRNQREPTPENCLDESGVSSRGFIQFHLRESLAGLAEYQIPFSILFLELKQFDHLRTTHGHEAAEAMARAVGETLRDGLRPDDTVGRWAEDQFMAVLSNCGSLGVEKAGERVHRMMANAGIQWWGDRLHAITLMGYATAEAGDTAQSLVQRAQPLHQPQSHEVAAAAAGTGSSGTGSSGS